MYGYCTKCDTLTATAIYSTALCASHWEESYTAVLEAASAADWEAAYARTAVA